MKKKTIQVMGMKINITQNGKNINNAWYEGDDAGYDNKINNTRNGGNNARNGNIKSNTWNGNKNKQNKKWK